MSAPVTYPLTRDHLYNMMGSEMTSRISTQVEEISVAIINAATTGLCSTLYSNSLEIPEYTVQQVRDRFPDCRISYTTSSSLEIHWA